MTYRDSKDTIINLIKCKVALLNRYLKSDNVFPEIVERHRSELIGMLLCLKNISSSNEAWCIEDLDYRIEFGYYDVNGKWISVE